MTISTDFNPRSSCEERHADPRRDTAGAIHISIHAPHARSDPLTHDFLRDGVGVISIHAPHARSDERAVQSNWDDIKFQSTLLMRGATMSWRSWSRPREFQSTLLMRGATTGRGHTAKSSNFNPRSSCEERLPPGIPRSTSRDFNPRSSCEERQNQ